MFGFFTFLPKEKLFREVIVIHRWNQAMEWSWASEEFFQGGGQQWWNFILPTPKLREKHFYTERLLAKYQISKSSGAKSLHPTPMEMISSEIIIAVHNYGSGRCSSVVQHFGAAFKRQIWFHHCIKKPNYWET